MSAPLRQSARIRSPGYQPRTTWHLPEIISVSFFSSHCEEYHRMILCRIQGVVPTTYQNRISSILRLEAQSFRGSS